MTTGEKIKAVRKSKGMNQSELAIICGLHSNSIISKYEMGMIIPSMKVILKIAQALEVDYRTLLSDNEKVAVLKHGKWNINPDGYYPYCSCCKEEPPSGIMTKYCPNCGARMDLKE